MSLSPGDRFDRYLVEVLLGRGGMGEVWRAVDPRLDRRIALKILSRSEAVDPNWSEARVRILREARAAAALDHPNVVAVFDVGEAGGTPYIAMELVEGVTLREYVGDPRVSAKRRVAWMIEIARALAAAHKRGIIHRDVKPENVMVRSDGALKVLDFGISRRVRAPAEISAHHASTATRDSEPLGTLMYMAPEQLEGARVDARCDQFAWGVVALELFHGSHPWGSTAMTPVTLVEAILRAEPTPLSSGADVPLPFVAAVARATSKSPADRFRSMEELLASIEGEERLPSARAQPTASLAFATTSGPLTFDDSPSPRLPFAPGDVIAGRYEVVRLLARGGMGEVYEARDARGDGRVALKTVRADRSTEPRVVERFRREVELARRVVHPNVVRVLDVCTHAFASASDGPPLLVLAMELLDGESLAEYLRRRGPLSTAETRSIARQMGDALAAAHAAGVVHRDFKSSNVVLVGSGRNMRAVVTDFGLSRAIAPALGDPSVSRGVLLLGTPAYMAPEQIEGGAVDARADVYAFGVVLFEMVTGRLPFAAATPIETAMMRLSQDPPSPRAFAPTLPPSWDAAIVRCLARDPKERFSTPREILAAMEGGSAGRWSGRTRRTLGALLGATALAGGLLSYRSWSRTAPPPVTVPALASSDSKGESAGVPPTAPRPAVAVLSLANASADPRVAWLGSALSEMLRTELSAGEALRIVPGASVARAERDLGISAGADLAGADVTRAATALGATLLVDGAYVAVGVDGGRRLRVDLHAKDAATGATLASIAEAGAEDELFELVERAAASLRAALRVSPAEAASLRMVRAALPGSTGASREYAEGTAAMQSLDYAKAREHFERAIAKDPAAPLPRAALSAALIAVGYVSRAADEAKAALDRAAGVSREDRLVIEAQYLQSIYDRAGCADRWHVLAGFFPDNVEYGLSLARAYVRAGDPARAKETIDTLRKLPPPAGDDPRLDLVAAEAVAGSDYHAFDAFARAALAKAAKTGSRSLATEAEELVARARGDLSQDLATLPDEYRRIERAYLDLGNRRAAVYAAMKVGTIYGRLNDWKAAGREAVRSIEAARALDYPDLEAKTELRYAQVLRHENTALVIPHLERALAIARLIGDRAIEEGVLNQRGSLLMAADNFAEARPVLEQAAKIAGAIGAKSEETDALDNLATVLANLGEQREALAIHERMAVRYAETGNRDEQFLTLLNEAVILTEMGDLGAAEARLDEGKRVSAGTQEVYALEARGTRARVLALRGERERAHAALEGIIEEKRKKGANVDAAYWEGALRQVDLMNGVSRTDDFLRITAGEKGSDAEAVADLAVSLALDGDTSRALASARRAVRLAKGEQAYLKRTESALRGADVIARAGHGAEALAISAPLLADAESRGLVPLVLLARLVAAHAADPSGSPSSQALLDAIAHDARSRGFVALARSAEGGGAREGGK